jgi:succinyl-diaminopimelate desuccinylase
MGVMSSLLQLLLEVLSIPSPTFSESAKVKMIKSWFSEHFSDCEITEFDDSLLVTFPSAQELPHLCLVGHSDTVPKFFTPHESNGRVYGSGASDMQAGFVGMMWFLHQHIQELLLKYRVSFILYSREEGTGLTQNGLYSLIHQFPDFFKSIDLAIVGEPTNLTVQLGCVGSIHVTVKVPGIPAHSARPWDGRNALYEALPFLTRVSRIAPLPVDIEGVRFFDVVQVTECQAEPGRTTVPGWFQCNINYRFAPRFSLEEAKSHFIDTLHRCGAHLTWITVLDAVPAGKIVSSPLLDQVVSSLGVTTEAKQAWTDVAQLSQLGISAFNFGPGLTAQAHLPDEYVMLADVEQYVHHLKRLFTGG